jgi:hypothetical protein
MHPEQNLRESNFELLTAIMMKNKRALRKRTETL